MYRKEHLAMDKKFLHNTYNSVHGWLDGTFYKYGDYRHWLERHHVEAINKKYGGYTNEYNSAYLHILCDFLSHFNIAFVPMDKEDCRRMLKSLKAINND